MSEDPPVGPEGDEPPSSSEKQRNIGRKRLRDLAPNQLTRLQDINISAAEQMRNAIQGPAQRVFNAMGGLRANDIRRVQQTLYPLGRLHQSVGSIAHHLSTSPLREIMDAQAFRHRELVRSIVPKWDHSIVGSAFAESLRSVQSLGIFRTASVLNEFGTVSQPLFRIRSLLQSFHPSLSSLTQLSDFWSNYPAHVKENLLALATAGWYLDPEMSIADIVHFKEDLETGTVEELNEEMAQHFRDSLDRIEESLCDDHPKRAHLISEAFAAHRDGKYGLSITALFAQADGICHDLTGYQIFTKTGISRFVKRIKPEALELAYLEPLLRTIPITESSQQRRARIPQLNRHAVMHGESVDFATEENGLKAISFINFVSHALLMAISRQQKAIDLLGQQDQVEDTQ